MRRSGLVPAVTVVVSVAALALTGCAPHPAASGSPSARGAASASPSASATPTASPLPADVLFQIAATATAPDGAKARLVEVVHIPVASTTTQSADETLLDNECDSWRTAFPTTSFLVANVTTTVLSGSWDADNFIATDMAGYPVWTGDQRPFQAYCASALPSIPGAARAVSPVGGGDADSDGGWAIYRYGFGVPTDPSAGDTASPTDVTLGDCSIQMGAAAKSSIFATTWPTTTQSSGGLSCFFGGS